MSDWAQYISVLGPMTSSGGSLVLQIKSLDASTNVTLSVTVPGSTGEDEITTCERIVQKINDVLDATSVSVIDPQSGTTYNLDDLQYNGIPKFSNEPFWPTFRVTQTDICACIWSQAQFRIRIVSNTTGGTISIGDTPAFATLTEVSDMAAVMGGELIDANGTPLTSTQIAYLIKVSSATLVSIIKNPLVMTSHLHELIGRGTGCERFKYTPIVTLDPSPNVRVPNLANYSALLVSTASVSFNVERKTGFVDYRFDNPTIEAGSPYDYKNEVKWSYIAGLPYIPAIVKQSMLQLAFMALKSGLETKGGIKSLKGGSGSIEWFGTEKTTSFIVKQLEDYRLF